MSERVCGTCTLCCKVLGIAALDKPMGRWCPKCAIGKGCTIYDERPPECRTFNCLWLSQDGLGPEWKPERSKFVLVRSADGGALIVQVDVTSPGAWLRAPYHATLRAWARAAIAERRQVVVMVADHVTVIMPDRDVPLGPVAPGDHVMMRSVMANGRKTIEPYVERGPSR